MLFEQMSPDTVKYMIAGYVVIFSVMAIYLLSLFLRWRNLQRDLRTLEEMQEKK
ncbi:MAG: hypothetical protein MUO30_08440 [Anaerolineales bacterium]|nr:hypothetical protein [Anaerolineales bacterium]